MTAPELPRLNNRQVAEIFADIGDLMLILGENRFKIIAYQNAARTIAELNQDINAVHAAGALRDIPGIGQAIAEKIDELLTTGSIPFYNKLTEQVPAGVVAMMRVPDVGPKTAKRLWEELDITGVEGLKAAAAAGRIRELKGFGAKSEEKILKGIELLARRQNDRTPIGSARPLAEGLIADLLSALPPGTIQKIELAGSLRRWRETIGDVDILAVSEQPVAVMEAFRALPQAVDILGAGDRKSSIALPNGMQVDIRVVEARHWGAALAYFTGSQAHNVAVRERAQKQGWSLNEYSLTSDGHPDFPDGTDRFFETEEALYAFLGLDWVAPELRENRGEVQAARQHSLPRLIELADIVGELHSHTTFSDGKATLEEMAAAAQAKGYEYWNVSDHSIGLGVTQGVDAGALAEQRAEIDRLNGEYAAAGIDFRLLLGTEAEVLADGTLGLPDDVLATLDVVVASIHTGLRQDRETITERCLKAVRNPHVDILGHPTGRLIGRREPSEIDLERVLQACAETGTIVEINANPARLDLSGAYARRAVELGCKLAINCDAHSVDQIDLLPYGVHTARRGWLTAADVINTRPLDEMLGMLKDRNIRNIAR
ncbi:MAG: DNA polymerase/3'-5' exonuclease PolX [Caldilineaceae bacterium]|nr:DNA polymerase/3'-5' exonuclease PolX [Caldilineaceae bacterium]